jgi:hypothetical protein
MWPLPPIRYEHVIVHIDRSSFSIGWIRSEHKQVVLSAYQSYEFQTLTHYHLSQSVATFISEHKLAGALLSLSTASPFIYEELVRLSSANGSWNDFQTPALHSLLWDFRYLHPLINGDHLFYVCGISRPTLFSYQLLATQNKLHIVTISSWYNTLMQAYRMLFGPAFRISQLAIDMERTEYRLEESLRIDSIARLLHIPAHITIDREKEKKSLISMIGLYYQERARS